MCFRDHGPVSHQNNDVAAVGSHLDHACDQSFKPFWCDLIGGIAAASFVPVICDMIRPNTSQSD